MHILNETTREKEQRNEYTVYMYRGVVKMKPLDYIAHNGAMQKNIMYRKKPDEYHSHTKSLRAAAAWQKDAHHREVWRRRTIPEDSYSYILLTTSTCAYIQKSTHLSDVSALSHRTMMLWMRLN